jgi:hypothetical protein
LTNVREPGEYLPNCLANVDASSHDKIGCFMYKQPILYVLNGLHLLNLPDLQNSPNLQNLPNLPKCTKLAFMQIPIFVILTKLNLHLYLFSSHWLNSTHNFNATFAVWQM